jgi:hypothetical protein
MPQKYYISYNDLEDVNHYFEIYDDNFVGKTSRVDGTVFLDYAGTDDLLEPIKGCGLRVELEADSVLTFSDIYTEEEKSFQVIYSRDSVVKFKGWLNPEGWYEDFVSDKWKVSFDCVDGLGFLDGLSYVDESGMYYVGKQSELAIISNCLLRTGLQQNINTSVNIVYTGLSTSLDVLANTYLNANRFFKDDKDTIMSSEEVLKSVLDMYGACITNYNGEWFIHKPNELFNSGTVDYFRYDYLGVALAPATASVDTSFALGSHVNAFYPHHCNANQSIANARSLGAYRINYKYGLVQELVENPYLIWDASALPGWTINSATNLAEPTDSVGAELTFDATPSVLNLTNDFVTLSQDDDITYIIKYKLISGTFDEVPDEYRWGQFHYKIILNASGTLWYLKSDQTWTNVDTLRSESIAGLNYVKTLTNGSVDPLPASGDLYIEIYTPTQVGLSDGVILLSETSIAPDEKDGDNNIIEGEFHTFQREDKPSSKVSDVEEVYNGDNPSGIYIGTIYKADQSTPTSTWNRVGVVEEKPLLQLMGEETLRANANTSRVFSGDVYGYFDYLSRVTIDGLTGIFIPIEYSYDTKNNVISATFKQLYGAELTDINYEVTLDYGKTVKPTIKG